MTSRLQSIPVLKAGLTERELLSVAAAYLSLKEGEGSIDWDKFIQLAGYSSVQSARICFRPVQKKLRAFSESGGGLGDSSDGHTNGYSGGGGTASLSETPKASKAPGTPGSKSRGRPKKRKAEDDGRDAAGIKSFAGVMTASPIANMASHKIKMETGLDVKVKREPTTYVDECAGAEMRAGAVATVGAQGGTLNDDVYFAHETAFAACSEQDDAAAFSTSHYEELDVVPLDDN